MSAQRRFAYDRYGNRTGVWDEVTGGTQIQSVALVESSSIPNNQIESVTENSVTSDYTYDAAGNVTDDGVNTFVYDAENRLVSVNSGAEQYKYDHQNRKVAKTVGSTTTQYVWEGSQVIAEHAASTGNVLVDYVFAGGRMVKKVEGGVTRYVLSDRLSARMMLDEDYDVVGKQSHLPFGEAMATSGEQDKHRFTSYERETSTGLDYAVNRWHSAGVGRFLQADPYKASGGARDPQSWNRYRYSRNDPVNQVDSTGLKEYPIWYWTFFDAPKGCLLGNSGPRLNGYWYWDCPEGADQYLGSLWGPFNLNPISLPTTGSILKLLGQLQLPNPPPPQAPYQQLRNDFINFLSTMSQQCQQALQSHITSLTATANTVQFYDLSYRYPDGSTLGSQNALFYVGLSAGSNDTLATWFARRQNGNIWNTATAMFVAPRPGIYFDGFTTQFTGANRYLLLHEMMHIVLQMNDVQLANALTITIGANQTASQAVSAWFNNGCK